MTPVCIAQTLNLNNVENDEEKTAAITTAITLALQESDPASSSLSTIYRQLSQCDGGVLLDALAIVPLLLSCKDPAAKQILTLLSECGSSKEVLIAVQEAVEHLTVLCEDSDDDVGEEDGQGSQVLGITAQLVTLIDLYASCIPRVKLRKKMASETISPLFAQLEHAFTGIGGCATRNDGRDVIVGVSRLVKRVAEWAKTNAAKEDLLACQRTLGHAIEAVLAAFEKCIQSSLARRLFEEYFPRLTVRSAVVPYWEGGHQAVLEAADAFKNLGLARLSTTPSMGSMIMFAHTRAKTAEVKDFIEFIPILVSSIETCLALDEALAILLDSLDPLRRPRPQLPDEIIYPLMATLPSLCSTHPEPLRRHQTFRILSLVLGSCAPLLHLQFLKELVNHSQFAQMRVAAVGLVKEAVLDALAAAPAPNVFASIAFLNTLGPVVFRTSPPDLFSDPSLSFEKFKASSEPARLVECLGLYYTVLQRDTANLTHIRDRDMLRHIEETLLHPLRSTLERWPESVKDTIQIASLQMLLQRIDEAWSKI